jgi:hypothetical protein
MAKKMRAAAPYTKYGKAPYRYSDVYQNWRAAILSGATAEASRLGVAHTRRFGSASPAPLETTISAHLDEIPTRRSRSYHGRRGFGASYS